jgi:hypothetical protein
MFRIDAKQPKKAHFLQQSKKNIASVSLPLALKRK